MLKEFSQVRQETSSKLATIRSGYRRFFTDENLQLYLWYDRAEGDLVGFQVVTLDQGEPSHAFTWDRAQGSVYTGVLASGFYNPSPILVANGRMPKRELLDLFQVSSEAIEPEVRSLVVRTIEAFRDGN